MEKRKKDVFNFTQQTYKIRRCFNINITLQRYIDVESTSKKREPLCFTETNLMKEFT